MNGLLHVSSSPHARSKVTTDKIMFAVLLALAPAACVGVWNFGLRALLLIVISMAVCPLTEYLYEKGMKKPVTIADGSALVTGLLLAMNMPVQAPLWMPVIGGVFAILVVKQLFGGLGQNIMNPALAGRCFLLISLRRTEGPCRWTETGTIRSRAFRTLSSDSWLLKRMVMKVPSARRRSSSVISTP